MKIIKYTANERGEKIITFILEGTIFHERVLLQSGYLRVSRCEFLHMHELYGRLVNIKHESPLKSTIDYINENDIKLEESEILLSPYLLYDIVITTTNINKFFDDYLPRYTYMDRLFRTKTALADEFDVPTEFNWSKINKSDESIRHLNEEVETLYDELVILQPDNTTDGWHLPFDNKIDSIIKSQIYAPAFTTEHEKISVVNALFDNGYTSAFYHSAKSMDVYEQESYVNGRCRWFQNNFLPTESSQGICGCYKGYIPYIHFHDREMPSDDEERRTRNHNIELLDCVKNLMAVIDTPVGRMRNRGEFVDEVRKTTREILKKYE